MEEAKRSENQINAATNKKWAETYCYDNSLLNYYNQENYQNKQIKRKFHAK